MTRCHSLLRLLALLLAAAPAAGRAQGNATAGAPDPAKAKAAPWTPPPAIELVRLIPEKPAEAAARIRKSWGDKALAAGARTLEKTTLLVAVTSPEPVALVRRDGGEPIGDLVKLDARGLHALAVTLANCQVVDYALRTASGRILGTGSVKIEAYEASPDSREKPGVPRGRITTHEWNESTVFPGTRRRYQVYVPAQYDGSAPAALMVFQDGLRHADPASAGGLRATTVFDNLIAAGEMPVTVGLFIDPGRLADQPPGDKPRNRSLEYDSLGDAYARFLIEEIIPRIVVEHGLRLSDDPSRWAIAGGSSGAACAWTVAWERPDRFGKVLGWVGTFVDIRGANAYPALIRKTERKPIRAALLGEANDLDNAFGNWPLANREMEAALRFQGYDHRYWWGEGFHGSTHAAVLLPEMLRWLWRDAD